MNLPQDGLDGHAEAELELLKRRALAAESPGASTEPIMSAYRLSPARSTPWIEQISADPDRHGALGPCLPALLPDMAARDAATAARVFSNLLKLPSPARPPPATGPESSVLNAAMALLPDLLDEAPAEFAKVVMDVTLWNLGMSHAGRPYVPVHSSLWYFSPAWRRGSLLEALEAKLAQWGDAGDGREGAVLDMLQSERRPHTKLVLLEALARDPDRHVRRILDALKSAIIYYDIHPHFGRYLAKVLPACSSAQVQEINDAFLNIGQLGDPQTESYIRGVLLRAIPARLRTADAQAWLKTAGC